MATRSPPNMAGPQQLTPPYSINDYISSNPTSPQRSTFANPHDSHRGTRQIRPPKSALYVPAVLRPTEFPSRRPLTPPRSLHSSTDSLSGVKSTNKSFTSSQPISIITTLTRTSTASSGPSTPSSVQPTRSHWKPDASTTHCEAPGCCVAFSLLTRRHHCRRCGGIYCSNHAGATVPLDELAQIAENGSYHRACDSCFRDWDGYSRGLLARREVLDQDRDASQAIPGAGNKKTVDAAGSVPRDWSWSTF